MFQIPRKKFDPITGLLVEDVQPEIGMATPTLNGTKQDWRARMFDRLVPQGDASIADEDKSRLFRQGLLQLAAGIQSSPNWTIGLANGLSGGLLSMNKGVDDIQDRAYKQQALDARLNDPAGLREFETLTQGLPDADKMRARRIRLGLDGRASSAGYEFELSEGADGKKRIQRRNKSNGDIEIYDETQGDFVPVSVSPPAVTGGAASLLDSSFDSAVADVLNTEGGYVANDAGAGPTNFGINSRANPDVNVASLTPETAKQLYRQRYWNAIDADNLPPEIRMAAFDAAVNQGVPKALEMLRQSGGDPQKFMELRQRHYNGLIQSNPERFGPYAQGWTDRNRRTANPALMVGRPKEVEAGAIEGAKIDATNARAGDTARTAAMTVDAQEQARINAFLRNNGTVSEAEARGAGAKAAATAAGTAQGERSAAASKKREDAVRALGLLKQAAELLPEASNGLVDDATNRAAAMFGKSTKSAQTDAQLVPIASQLTATVPRFEGPQSNIDVAEYKKAAGDLANPLSPRETRIAAIKSMVRLYRKSLGLPDEGGATKQPASSGARRLKYNPKTGKVE